MTMKTKNNCLENLIKNLYKIALFIELEPKAEKKVKICHRT